jgi:hypothetical protein
LIILACNKAVRSEQTSSQSLTDSDSISFSY